MLSYALLYVGSDRGGKERGKEGRKERVKRGEEVWEEVGKGARILSAFVLILYR